MKPITYFFIISKKYGLRPPLVTPKGTKVGLLRAKKLKHTTLNFRKELDGTWGSGVIILIVKDDDIGKYRLAKKGGIDFRNERYQTAENIKEVTELSNSILEELNN